MNITGGTPVAINFMFLPFFVSSVFSIVLCAHAAHVFHLSFVSSMLLSLCMRFVWRGCCYFAALSTSHFALIIIGLWLSWILFKSHLRSLVADDSNSGTPTKRSCARERVVKFHTTCIPCIKIITFLPYTSYNSQSFLLLEQIKHFTSSLDGKQQRKNHGAHAIRCDYDRNMCSLTMQLILPSNSERRSIEHIGRTDI